VKNIEAAGCEDNPTFLLPKRFTRPDQFISRKDGSHG